MYVCICKAVTEQELRDGIEDGATFNDVIHPLRDGGHCCRCFPKILEVYREEYSKAGAPIG